MTGRMTLWSNLILNKDISIGTPESFKVLVCELQALCLDIGLFRYNESTNDSSPLALLPPLQRNEERTNKASYTNFSSTENTNIDTYSQKHKPLGSNTTSKLREIDNLINLP
jgi:DNA-directed RNA polymerase subunit beta